MPVPDLRPLADHAQVVAAADGHPLARNTAATSVHGWAGADAVVWTGEVADRPRPLLAALGSPTASAELIDAVADLVGPAELSGSVPRGCLPLLQRWSSEQFSEWDLFACTAASATPVSPTAPVSTVGWLCPADDGDIAALLDEANPGSSARPGGVRVRRWAGSRDNTGQLVSCGADTSRIPGLGHLSGIATLPAARGRGLGGNVTAFLTRELLDGGCDTVCLGMYADNAVARSVYRRLGYREVAWSTGAVLRRPAVTV